MKKHSMHIIWMMAIAWAMDIRLQGNQWLDQSVIFKEADFPNNAQIDAWNQAVKRLYRTGWFDHIKVDVQADQAIVFVKEYPPLRAFKVESRLNALKPDRVIDMLTDSGIVRGQPVSRIRVEQWRLLLLQELKKMGHEEATVTLVWTSKDDGNVLEITIDPGRPTRIRKIHVQGDSGLPAAQVSAVLDLKQASLWRYWDGANQVSLESMRVQKEKLQQFYEAHGYFDAKIHIAWQEVSQNSKARTVDVLIQVDAGQPLKVVHVQEMAACPAAQSALQPLLGQIYNADQLRRQLESSLVLSDEQIRVQPRRVSEGIELMAACFKPPKMVIRDVEILGDGTDDLLLRRLLDFDAGDEWRSSWVDRSKRRLLAQPFIADANIVIKPIAGSENEADVVVKIEESKKNTVASARLTYEQGGSGLGFGGGLSNRNFLGSGNALTFEMQYSPVMWFTDLQLVQPLMPHEPAALMGFSFRVTNQDKLALGQYKQDSATAYYGYRWLLSDQFLMQSQLSLRANHFEVFDERAEWLMKELARYGYDPLEFAFNQTWVRDTRDRAERTTSGTVSRLSANVVVPVFSEMMSYFQISPSWTGYWKLTQLYDQAIVLRANMQLGYGQSYGRYAGDLPFYARYYAGGIGTVRGYNLFSLGPSYYDHQGNRRVTGGNWLVVGNLDVLLPSPWPDIMQPSLFVDAGNVYLNSVDMSTLRYSTGFSTAINTPLAQLTVTCATFMNAHDEPRRTISIEMGRQF